MEAIVFTKIPWPVLSDTKYWMLKDALKLGIEAQHRQRVLAAVPVGTPAVCQLSGIPSVKIYPQTLGAVTLAYCIMLLYQISDTDYAPKYM